jgi:hypothetical protein
VLASWALIVLLVWVLIGWSTAKAASINQIFGATANTNQALTTTSSTEKLYVTIAAISYGVSPLVADFIIQHESQWDPGRVGDDGNSRGLWQISSIYHSEVSNACAYSVVCSTNWALNWIAKGNINQWSTWRFRCKWYKDSLFC